MPANRTHNKSVRTPIFYKSNVNNNYCALNVDNKAFIPSRIAFKVSSIFNLHSGVVLKCTEHVQTHMCASLKAYKF